MATNQFVPGTDDKSADQQDWSSANSFVLDAAGAEQVHVPDGGWILQAQFVRQGPDLLLVGQDGAKVLIKSFFKFADPPDLVTPDGAVINGPLAVKLAGPAAPGVEAQAAPAGVAEPIGKIVTVSGKVEATHADGTKVTLKVGDPVYQGDVIETGALGAVGMEFADESTFSLADNGRMVLDEMVYDPQAQTGAFGASIVQGAFSFISGQIAKTGPDNMLINTPTATIGIRGTALAGRAAPEGEQSNFTILPEGNFVGEVVISNNAGTMVLNQVGATVSIASINLAPPPPIIITAQQIQQQYGGVLRYLPPSPSGGEDSLVPGQQGDNTTPPDQDALDTIAEKLAQLDQAIAEGILQQQVQAANLGNFQKFADLFTSPLPGGPQDLPPDKILEIFQQSGLAFDTGSFTSVNEALSLLNAAATTAANAETAASTAVSSLSGSLSILAPNAGLSTTETDSLIEVVVAPLEALNAARALSEALVTMIQSAQAMLSVAASGGEIDADTLTALREAVGLDGAAGENLVTSANEMSAVVNAAIAAATQAKIDAVAAAGGGLGAARNAAATSFNNNINAQLTAAGATTTDINNLQNVVDIVTTKVTAIRDVVAANPDLPDELLSVLNLAVQAADAADQAATAAQGTLNTTDPAVMLAAKADAITAAETVNGLKAQAITAFDTFAATRSVDPAVIAQFQQAVQDANTAETAADTATAAIEGASQAREAAQAFKDGTAEADLTTKQAATTTANATATAEKAEATAVANDVLAARATLLTKLTDEAVDQATFDTFEDAAKSAEAIQKGASDGDKGDVVADADGGLTYVVDTDNAIVDGLNPGDSTTDSFKIAIENETGGFDLQIITVTITNVDGAITVSDDVTITSGSGDTLATVSGTLSGLTADGVQQNLDAAEAELAADNAALAEATAAANAAPGTATLEAALALATQEQANSQAAVDFQEDVLALFQNAAQVAQARARGIGDGDKGEVTFDSDGNVVYTPDADAYADVTDGNSATDTFLIAAQNDSGGYDISSVQVTVTNNGGTLVVSNSTTVTAPDGTTASVNLDALDDVASGQIGHINGARQIADVSGAAADSARDTVETLEAVAQAELTESLAAINALAEAQSAEAQAEGYLAVAQAAAEAQADAALEIAVDDVTTLTNQLATLADAVNGYADDAQANAIVGTADKVAANAAANSALEALLDLTVEVTGFDVTAFLANDTAGGNADLQARTDILDFPAAATSDPALRTQVAAAEAEVRDALIDALDAYVTSTKAAVTNAANLSYASDGTEAVAARAAAVTAANALSDRADQLIDLVKAKSVVASAAADLADFINPEPENPEAAAAAFALSQKQEAVAGEGLVSATAGSTPDTIVITGNVPNQTFTVSVSGTNGGAIDDNDGTAVLTTATTETGGQVTTITILGTPEIGDTYAITITADLDPDAEVEVTSTVEITVDAELTSVAALRAALAQAINFDDILGGAEGQQEAADAAAETADAAAAAKTAADLAAYNEALGFADAAVADAATAAQYAATAAELELTAQQAAQDAATAEANNDAIAADAAATIAETAADAAELAQQLAAAAAESAELNGNRAIVAASGAGKVVVNGTSTSAAAQANRASIAAAEAAAAAGAALQSLNNAEASASDARSDADLQSAEDEAAGLAQAAAQEALEAAEEAAEAAQEQADAAAAQRAAERAQAAEEAALFKEQAEAFEEDDDPETLDAAQALATAKALAASNVPGAAALAADAAEAARNAANKAQTAADAAQTAARGKGPDAQEQADLAQAAATRAAQDAGAAEAAAVVAANADAAVTAWTSGDASEDRAAAALAARDAAAAAARAAAAAETANATADQATADAVAPNVALAAAQATVASRTSSLEQVEAARDAASDGDDSVTTAIEQVWQNAVEQAEQALSDAEDALAQAQAAADAANENVTIAQANADAASQAAAEAASQAAQAASQASFAAAFEINAQGAAQTRVDNFLDDLTDEVGDALSDAKDQATIASQQAALATAAATGDTPDADAAQAAAEAAEAAAQAALDALLQVAEDLDLPISAETAQAVINAINTAADAAAALDDLDDDVVTTDNLSTAQDAADTTQLAAVAAIKAAAASAQQAVAAANAALQVAQKQAAVAAADEAGLDAARVEAAEAALAQAQADAQASADQAAADSAEAAAAQASAQTRVSDIQAIVNAATAARTAATTAGQAATDAQTSLSAAQTALATARTAADAAQADFTASADAQTIDPAAYQSVKQANDRAQAALQDALDAVAKAQAAYTSASEAATTADEAADLAELYRDGGVHPDTGVTVVGVNLAAAQAALATANTAAEAALGAYNTARAAADDAAALTSPGGTAEQIQAVADQASDFATAAETAATTAASQADTATAALADIPRAATARSAAQAAADDAQSAAATAEGVAQTDTVTLDGTIENGDVYRVTIDGDVVSVTVGTDTADAATGITIADVRTALVNAINDTANGATDSVVAAAGSEDGAITLTAAMPGVGFTATASATNNGAVDDQSATASTVTGNLGGATQVAQLDTVTLQGTVQGGDTYSVTINGTVVSLIIPTDNSITTLTQVRDALVTAINDSAAGAAVTASAGDTGATLAITADVAGVAFTATATATDGGGNADNVAQSVTTTANLRGADDLAAQAATDAETAATTAEAEAAKADAAAETAAASIAAKNANDDAVEAADEAATQAVTAKTAAANAALYARTAKAVGDAVSEALSRNNPNAPDDDDLLDAIEAQLETAQVTRVTLSGTIEAGDTFTITVGTTQATFTVTTQTTATEVRDAFIQQLADDDTFDGLVDVSQGATGDSIRLTGVTPGTAFTTTTSVTNVANGTNDQAARVQRQIEADQVTQEDTITIDSGTVVADGDSFSFEVAGTAISVSTASGEINVGDDADAVRDALVTAIQNAGIAAVTVAAGGAGALVLTATQAGAAGAFLTVVAEDGPLDLDAISNGSVADRAAEHAVEASDAAEAALAAANAASDAADDAQTAAQAAANQDGAGSVAQGYLTDTQSQVTATNSSVASAVRDAAAAAQSATSAQAQADLAGADVGAVAAAITAANNAAILAADEDADTAAEAAEAALAQAKTSATAALSKAQDAIDDSAEMLELATSFNQITLTGTPAAGDEFTLTVDPTPGDVASDDTITVTVTANDGDTIDDIRDALVDAVNDEADLQGIAKASATSGSGGLVVAAATSGGSIGVTVTEDGDATGAENASELILGALTAANTARTTINDLLADNELDGDGDTTAAALDNVVDALDLAIAATRQTVSVTIGGTVEAGDTLTVAFDTNNDGNADFTKTITVGANPTLASVRDALVAEIGTTGGMTAAAALQDGELVLISDDPTASFTRVTVSTVNEDGISGEAPTISVARTGAEAALRALRNGLDQASTIAETIENAVDIAGTAAGTARAAANGLDPDSAATIVGTANSLGGLTLDANVPADVVTAAQLLAEIAEGYVPDALSGAATANAQATIAQQAAFQAAAGLAQFEQVINKARNEAELRIQQEARDSAPVAGDEVIGDGDAANGAPVSGDDEVLEDQAITFDILSNDKRADGGELANATIAAVGQPAHGKIAIVPEVRELTFGPAFTDGDTITLTINGVSVTYTLDDGSNAEGNAALFVDLINNTPAMAAEVSAVSAGRGGAITLTSAVPGTPIVTTVETQGDVNADADTVTVPNGRVTYTPDADYNGTDTFTYTVSNGATPPSFDTATVTIDITATNDNPDAKNDFITTSDDSTAISKTAATGLLANDTDIDTGDSLTVIKVSDGTVGVARDVNFTLPNGDPAVAQVTINADGSYTVNPDGQFEQLAAGQSVTGTLTYTVSDGHAGTDDQTITPDTPTPNDTGVNQISTYTVSGTIERGDVYEITVNGTRISHTVTDETTANEVRDAIVGKLNANGMIAGKVAASAGGGGEVVITANLAGQAFTTSAQAINAGTDVATLSVTITGSNDAPVADADTASGDEDTTITGTLTAADPDLGDTLTFALAGGGQATNGTVTIQSDGSFSYVPNAEFSGTDSFTFRVIDAAGIASTATVSITVNNVNDDPVITAGGDPTPTFEESGPAVIIDGAMTIADVDTANFNTGFLRAQVTDNLDPGDHLLIQEAGDITLSGSDVLFGGVVIGTIDGTDDGSAGNLLIALDVDATPEAVQALARTIAFTNDAETPTTVARTVTFTVDSGDGGSTTQDATVQVALESGLTRSDHNQLNFSGDWFDAANWTSGIPDATTIAVLNDGGYAPITFNNGPVDETVGQLVVNADLNILAGILNVLEPSAVEQDATVTVSNASVLGTGDLNIAGTVALGGAATLGLPLITLDAAENGGIHGELTVTGSGNQIDGALAIIVHSGYFGELILGGSGSGNVALDVTLGIVNAGAIVIDNFDAAPADAILTVGNPGIANTGTITFSDTSGGGGQRVIEGSIDTANGTITVNAGATIDLAGGILNAVGGTIDLATATILTVSGGQTVVDSDTYLSGTGTLDLAGTGSLTLTSDFTLDLGDPELTLSGAITIEGSGSDILTIGDGRSLTLDGDEVSGSVNLAVDGTLTIEGTGTVIAAPTTINSPNGAFTVAPGATVTITAPGFLSNNGGEISIGAGGTLILDGVNIQNAGVITGEGTIQLANGANITGDGTIDVAGIDNVGTLNITDGTVVFDNDSALDIDIGLGGTNDVLNLDTMDLTAANDSLSLNFADGFDPVVDGHQFQIMTYSGHDTDLNDDATLDNIFDNVQHNLGPEYTLNVDYGDTVAGAVTVTVSRIPEIAITTNGAGMQFDGIDDVITIPTDPAIINAASITVEAVINLAGAPQNAARIVENFNGDYAGWGFTIATDGALIIQLGDGGTDSQLSNFTTAPGVVIPDQPTHVAFTYDGPSGEITVYVNGVDVGGTPSGVDPVNNLGNATQDVTINHPVFPLKGSIDEFRIYDEARTADEIASDAGGDTATGTAPLVHFDFADGTATNLGSLGSNADGVLGTSAASGEANDPHAVPLVGQALSLDGTVSVEAADASVIDLTASAGNTLQFIAATDQIVAGQAGTFAGLSAGQTFSISGSIVGNDGTYTIARVSADGSTITVQETGVLADTPALASDANIVTDSASPLATGDGAFTYESWFRQAPGDGGGTIIRVGDPSGDYGQVRLAADGKVQGLAPGLTQLDSVPGFNDGLWHHVAFVHDGGGNLELFVDGVSVATTSAAINSIDSGVTMIGGYLTGNQPFTGELFDVRAYDIGRAQADILADMHILPDGTDPNLTGAWHLDDVLNGTTNQFRDVTGNGATGTYSDSTPEFAETNLFTMAEESTLHGRIIATDADDVNDTEVFTYGVVAQGANGTVTVNPDGTWEYTPNADFVGTDSFEVQVTDSLGAAATKTVSVNVLNVNDAPTVASAGPAADFIEDGAPVLVDANIQITDSDSADLDGGTLAIDISAGSQAGDVLAIDESGPISLSGPIANGVVVNFNGTPIGTIDSDGTNGVLTIDLNPNATANIEVENLARSITFQNDTAEPDAGLRTISFTLSDGDGGTSAIFEQTVTITPTNDAPEIQGATDAGASLQFSGTGEYVATPVTTLGADFTIETWFKTGANPADGNYKSILSKQTGGFNDTAEFNLQVQADGNLNFFMGLGGTTESNIVNLDGGQLPADTWYHVAVTFDDATGDMVMYLNGEQVDQNVFTGGARQIGGNPIEIGHYDNSDDGEQYYEGKVDDVRIWNTVRSAEEIADNYQTAELYDMSQSLVAHWTFDDVQPDGTVFDYAGNGNNIQLYQGPPVEPSAAALQFDGIDDSISLADPSVLPTGTADFTWSAWVKTAPAINNQAIFTLGNVAGNGEAGQLLILPNGQLALDSSGINSTSGGPDITDGEWHHVAATTASGLTELFVDGVSVSSPFAQSLNIGTDAAFIGMGIDGTSFPFGGEIADVRIYDVARSVGDIAADMDTRLTGGESNLVGYYPLNETSGSTATDLSISGNDGTLQNGAAFADTTSPTIVAATPSDTPGILINATTAFADDFNDGTLDPAAFTVDTASSGASAAEAGGALTLGNRAIVTTTAEYAPAADAPVVINTSFTFQDTANDFFSIVTRSDGVADAGNFYQVTNGISFVTQAAGDNKITILRYENGVSTGLADSGASSISLTNGTTYDVEIADDGENLYFTVTEAGNPANTVTLTAQDSTQFAENHVSLYNREVVANGPQIDSLEIVQSGGLLAVPEDGFLSSQIIANDVEGDSLTFTLDADAENGTVTLQPDGSFTYTPDPEFSGIDRFSVTVDDGNGGISTRAITLDVESVNDAPVILGAQANIRTPQFDGIDDFIQATDPNSLLPSGNAPFTIETWVQPAAAGTLAALGLDTGNQGLEIFITESGELGIGTDDRTTIEIVDTGNAIDDGAWHHIAVAYDGTTFRLYVDGAETASGTGTVSFSGGEVTFGKDFNDTDYFKGAIDDIRIWADERTAQEIADNHQQNDLPDSTDLTARYTLDHASSDALDNDPTLIDVSGNGHVITAGGPPSDPFGAYAVLDGAGDMINFTQVNPIGGTDQITIAAWIKPDDLTGTQAIAAIGAGDLVFALDGNGLSFTNGGSTGTAASGTLTAGEWNHVAVTYDGDTGAFETFVNGTLQGSGNVGSTPLPVATTMAIGSSNGDGSETPEYSFAGGIAQVRIFDEVRDATGIQTDMAQGHFNGQPPASLLNNLSLDGRLSNDQDNQGLTNGTFTDGAHFVDHSPTLLGANVNAGAIHFDGIDDQISISGNPGLDPDSWTVETWLRSDADDNATGVQRLLTLSNGTHAAYSLLFQDGDLSVEFTHQGGASSSFVTAVDNIRDGLWHHAAGTYDSASNTLSLFVDGHLVGQIDTTGITPVDGTADLVIGNFTTGHTQRFTGEMADMRIWEYPREEWQIANDLEEPVSPDSPGLVANFPLNGGSEGELAPAIIFDTVDQLTGNVDGAPVFAGTGPAIYGGFEISAPLSAEEDTTLRGRIAAEDIDGDGLTFTLDVDATNGSVALNPDGSYEYTPNPDTFGTDSFTVTVSDGFGGTDTRTIYLDVAPVTDVFIGGNGDDILYGTDGDDILDGRAGENILIGDAGDDYLTGGTRGKAGVDRNVADYSDATDFITVNADNDTVIGAATGTDTLGNIDQIIGSEHDDDFNMTGWDNGQFDAFDPISNDGQTPTVGDFNVIRGGDGDDTITGNGFTRVDYGDAMGGVTVTLTDATDGRGYGHLTSNNAGADGGDGGVAAFNEMDGTGLDIFTGGVNEIAGSDYSDVLTGNDNNNVLIGRGGNDILDGGGGMDRADYRGATAAINVDLTLGSGQVINDGEGGNDTLIDIEQIRGSQFDDVFIGNGAANRFRGEGGADTFTGGDGDDRFEYTRGDESVAYAYDMITDFKDNGDADTIRFKGMEGLELMTVGYAYAGTIESTVNSIRDDDGVQDRVTFFTDGADGYLYVKGQGTGTTNYDGTLIKLQDVTAPLAGADVLDANNAALIETTGGTNTIAALTGQQTHTGGAGPNYFVFTAETDSDTGAGNRDTITDFVAGEDKIVLEGLIADGIEFSYEGISLVGDLGNNDAAAGFGLSGNVLQIDLDGDFTVGTGADMHIEFVGVEYTALTDDDFILITTGTAGDDSFTGRLGNDWILASATTSVAPDVASVTGGDTINLAGGGSGGDDTLIIRDPMEFIGAEWSGSDLMLFYEDIGSTYVHKTTVTNHAVNSLDHIEFNFNDGDALDRFAVANGSDASGGAENTLVAGGSGIDTLVGSAHDDILLGNDGDDNLNGGGGDDLLIGGAGEDILDGGAGNDTVSYFQNPTNGVIVNLSNTMEGISPEAVSGGTAFDPYSAEIDTLRNIENAEGSSFDDFLIGSDVTNRLSGDAGEDHIYGGGGADILEGGSGNDVFIYGSVADSGLGGLLRDVILDFDALGADKIDISAFNEGMFMFVGDDTNDFAGYGASSARFNDQTKILEIDADGDAQADMEIELQNVDGADLDANDFIGSGGQVA